MNLIKIFVLWSSVIRLSTYFLTHSIFLLAESVHSVESLELPLVKFLLRRNLVVAHHHLAVEAASLLLSSLAHWLGQGLFPFNIFDLNAIFWGHEWIFFLGVFFIIILNEAIGILLSKSFICSFTKGKVLNVNIEKDSARNKEDCAYNQIEESKGSLQNSIIADTKEAKRSEWVLRWVFWGSSSQAIHSNAHNKKAKHPHKSEERKEDTVISDTNAIINPRAMVIESFDTNIADSAMSRPRSTDNFAIRAQFWRVKLLK